MLKSKTEVVFVPRTYYYTLQDNTSSQTFEQARSPYWRKDCNERGGFTRLAVSYCEWVECDYGACGSGSWC